MAPGLTRVLAAGLVAGFPNSANADTNPLAKVIDLMHELKAKVEKDAETEAKAYHDFQEWCDDSATNGHQVVETNTKKKEQLETNIEDLTSNIDASTTKIGDLAAAIANAGQELKDASAIRAKEAAQFANAEKDLMGTVDALTRAISLLEKEMAKNPASFAQVDAMDTTSLGGLLQALNALMDAAALSGADHQKLVALVQARQGDEDDDDSMGAPAAASYKTHSGGIMEVLEDMKEKAETELSDTRKAEGSAKHNFKMLQQSLTDESKANARHMKEEKTSKAEAEAAKATAQGELEVTNVALQKGQGTLGSVQSSCMTTAADHEKTVASRNEELKVIEQATKILQETTSGASGQTYSLLQASLSSKAESHAELARLEVVGFLKGLAKKHRSAALFQLASRIAAVARFGNDPFAKVKQLIQDMIAKLEQEAQASATEKAWCDEQLAKTELKRSELDDDSRKLSTKIDVATARSSQLKSEVKGLQGELAALAKATADMDRVRQEENSGYKIAKADLELGLNGVRKALDVLRSYYGSSASFVQEESDSFNQQPSVPQHSQSSGAGGSIINILEVVESDFADNLAKVETEEADAVDEYDKVTQENKVAKANMDQGAKYKTQEFEGLDQHITELTADRESTNAELSSVMEYYGQVKDRCIAKPETYEERQAKRQAEIEGLKQALSILSNEAAFVQQRHRRHGSMRGALEAQ